MLETFQTHSKIRQLLALLETAKIDRAVLVTCYPADDYIFRAELELSNDDIDIATDNLNQLGFPVKTKNPTNLWLVISQAARKQDEYRTAS